MNFKKHIASLLSAALIFGLCPAAASADEAPKYAAVTDVSCTVSSDGTKIGLKINSLPDDNVYNSVCVLGIDVDISDGMSTEDISKAVYASDNSANTAGREYEFFMPDSAESGDYVIVVGGSEAKSELKNRTRVFRYVKDGDSHTYPITAITEEELSADGAPWYINKENKAWKNNRKAVISVMNGLSGESGFADARQLEEAFEISCRLLDGSDLDYEMLDAYITYRNSRGSAAANALMLATDNEDYKAYRENTTKMFLSLLGSDASLTSLDDIRDKFMQACAVTCINENDDVSKVIEKLKKYNGIFRLDFGAKSDFSTVPELDVAMSFVGDRSFSSPEEITAEFNRRVGELKSKGGSGSGSGGGSVGSGSGSSGNKGGSTPSGTNDYSRIDDILNRDYPFYDVARDSWAREYIKFVYDNNIMTGDGDGNFRPNDCISREEIVKTLFAAFAIKTDEAVSEFKDVAPDSWSYPYISKAYEMTVVNGISDDLFAPKEKITRQDAAALIYRLTKMTRSGYEFTSADITFTDKDDIAEYAQEAMKTLISMGVMGGYDDGSFRPCQTITRAETAKIIMTLLNAVG